MNRAPGNSRRGVPGKPHTPARPTIAPREPHTGPPSTHPEPDTGPPTADRHAPNGSPTGSERPLHVIASTAEAASLLRRLNHDGWYPREGFTPPENGRPDRLVCYGRVPDQDTAHRAVRAAALGAGIVAVTDPATEPGRSLVTDLRRHGRVSTAPVTGPATTDPAAATADRATADRATTDRVAADPIAPADRVDAGDPAVARDPVAALIPEQRALLERLAGGDTIAAAAAAEFLSLRTANRRIAEARALLGVRTTREAVHAYLHHHPRPPH